MLVRLRGARNGWGEAQSRWARATVSFATEMRASSRLHAPLNQTQPRKSLHWSHSTGGPIKHASAGSAAGRISTNWRPIWAKSLSQGPFLIFFSLPCGHNLGLIEAVSSLDLTNLGEDSSCNPLEAILTAAVYLVITAIVIPRFDLSGGSRGTQIFAEPQYHW